MKLSEQLKQRTCQAIFKEHHDWGLLYDEILKEIIVRIQEAADQGHYKYSSTHFFSILKRDNSLKLGKHIAKYLANYFRHHGFDIVNIHYGGPNESLSVYIEW